MTRHLDNEQMAAAVAGLELEAAAKGHLGSCLTCRREVQRVLDLLGARQRKLEDEAPDWTRQQQQIMNRLPATPVVPLWRSVWLRPAAAVAAVLVLAVGVAMLVDRDQLWRQEVDVERVLAEVESILEDDGIPGFEALVALGDDDDMVLAESDTMWDEDSDDIPGFEALDAMVPGLDEMEHLLANGVS